MNGLMKTILIPVCILIACLLAGLFGTIHNQVSYTISPDYFHGFKFHQFRIPPTYQNRIGAAIVGWLASWWMGIPLGLILSLVGLCHERWQRSVQHFFHSTEVMFAVTAAFSLLGIVVGLVIAAATPIQELVFAVLPDDINTWQIHSPYWFCVAGTMHDFSYLGGVIALFVGIYWQIRLKRIDP